MFKRLLMCSCLCAGCFSELSGGGGSTTGDTGSTGGGPSTSTSADSASDTTALGSTGSTATPTTTTSGDTGTDTSTSTTGSGPGSSSSSTDGGSSGSTGEPTEPVPGSLYAHCFSDDQCDGDMWCLRIDGPGISMPRGFCTADCVADADCPAPAWFGTWTGSSVCDPNYNNCVADCGSPQSNCPSDMSCEGYLCMWLDP